MAEFEPIPEEMNNSSSSSASNSSASSSTSSSSSSSNTSLTEKNSNKLRTLGNGGVPGQLYSLTNVAGELSSKMVNGNNLDIKNINLGIMNV